jgi:hypothetical protein
VLCLSRLQATEISRAPLSFQWRVPQKMGPLWKLMLIVEPRPPATESLVLRDEKAERFVLDGPFTETKS